MTQTTKTHVAHQFVPIDRGALDALSAKGKANPSAVRTVRCRTVAEGKPVADLHKDLLGLEAKWKEIHANLPNAKAPLRILNEIDRTSSMIRAMLNADFTNIVLNDEKLYE